jgi:Plant transposon protein
MDRISKIPVEFKIMVALRILGRDHDCDSVYEVSGVPASTCNYLFRQFVSGMRIHYFNDMVYFPRGEELRRVMEVYRLLGFPGAAGSMDGTHCYWAMCPAEIRMLCKGKEGYPTLGWLAIVDHNRKVLYITDAFWGAENDIDMCRNDKFYTELLNGKLSQEKYFLLNSEGQPILTTGNKCFLSLICAHLLSILLRRQSNKCTKRGFCFLLAITYYAYY